ncbi:MAG: potassium channel family protein [Pseudomonadota bacterium]|nr:potassium channel family protein [Pseudomonadota bacterium]
MGAPRWRGGWQDRLRDPSLTALLVIELLFIFVASPLAALGIPLPSAAAGVAAMVFILVAVAVSQSVGAIVLMVASGLLGFAGLVLRLREPSELTDVLSHGAGIFALVALSVVVARAVFRPGRVTYHRIRGAIVLYLNIALIFTAAYRLVAESLPGAFHNLPTFGNDFATANAMLYFSFTTLTSTGFGDIVPVHPIARALANLEAVIGQLYPATLLARIVTLELETRRH